MGIYEFAKYIHVDKYPDVLKVRLGPISLYVCIFFDSSRFSFTPHRRLRLPDDGKVRGLLVPDGGQHAAVADGGIVVKVSRVDDFAHLQYEINISYVYIMGDCISSSPSVYCSNF